MLLNGVATAEWFGLVLGVFCVLHVKRPLPDPPPPLPPVILEVPVCEAERWREMPVPPVTSLWVEALRCGYFF